MDDDRDRAIERLRHRTPGPDEDPYEDVDISTLPDWWRRGIREHREYGLRPYRPPRFRDGEITVGVVEKLESKYDVTIRFRGVDVEVGESWTVFVDGEPIADVDYRRDPDGYSVYDIDSEQFRRRIREECTTDRERSSVNSTSTTE